MNRVPSKSLFSRWMLRPVLLLLALAQMVVVVAPAMDRGQDSDVGIHLESEGSKVHYVHDDTACPSCQAQQLVGRIVSPARLAIVDVLRPGLSTSASISPPSGRVYRAAAPRAPPGNRVV